MVRLTYTKPSTHKECIHFNNGVCTFYGIPVNPDQTACPNFIPKTTLQPQMFTFQPNIQTIFLGSRMRHRFRFVKGPSLPTPTQVKEQKIALLENQIKVLEEKLKQVKKRLTEL